MWACVCDVLTGFGLVCLLQFSAVSPNSNLLWIVASSVLLGMGIAFCAPCARLPNWLRLCNSTFSLLISLAVLLDVMNQLCPPREFSLIPVYILVCTARVRPSLAALQLLAVLTVLLALVFISWSLQRGARPQGTDPLDLGSSLEVALTVAFACVCSTFDAHHDRTWSVIGVFVKGFLLFWLGSAGASPVYYFMFERDGAVPVPPLVLYGILLLFACMQTAAKWFEDLKALFTHSSARALVRIQHIINALLVGAAWAFPLQLHLLRCLLVAVLLAANLWARL